MDFTQLNYFRATARAGSISRAANALFVTQSALSKSIATLERSLGTRLFDRVGNSICLNEQGKMFLDYAERVLEMSDEVQKKMLLADDPKTGKVTYSIPSGGIFYDMERKFLIENPSCHLVQRVYNSEEAFDALTDRNLDFAFSFLPIEGQGVVWEPIQKNVGFSVILAADHPLAKKEGVYLEELKNERFFANNANSGSSQVVTSLFKKAGFEPNIVYEGDDLLLSVEFFAKYGVVSVSVGLNYCSALGQTFYNGPDGKPIIRAVPLLDEDASIEFGVARVQGRYMSRTAYTFYNYIVKELRSRGEQLP